MGQQTTTKVTFELDNSYLTKEKQDQEFFQTITRVTDLKSLNQAIHNIDLGIANHQAAESAPKSMAMAEDFLRTINKLDHKY